MPNGDWDQLVWAWSRQTTVRLLLADRKRWRLALSGTVEQRLKQTPPRGFSPLGLV